MDVRAAGIVEAELTPEEWRQVLPFLPMIYVAWADGDLAREELEGLKAAVESKPPMSVRARAAVLGWLDPARPPSPRRLHALLGWVRAQADTLSRTRRWSLADLGVEIARAHAAPGEPAVSEAERAALAEVEEVLGIVGHEAARRFFRAGVPAPAEDRPRPPFAAADLAGLLDGAYHQTRDMLRRQLGGPDFAIEWEWSKETHRQRVTEWVRRLAAQGLGGTFYPTAAGGGGDFGRFLAVFETLGLHDASLTIKFGVQFGLFGGAIHFLGNERQQREYLPRVSSLELPGCFAMTERGHGSNVRDLETIARYDASTQQFVIHTPTPSAHKEYIGNAARDGIMAVVFAQLEVGNERHGVHALLVPIRQPDGRTRPGVSIEDTGHKMGLNGVDNGRIWFDEVRVPRENLLDRFGGVDEKGEYRSTIPSAGRRFFTMLGTLVGGRLGVACAGLSAAKVGLAIAVRYGDRRRQFGPDSGPEVPILDYPSHQRRLMPLLASTYALDFACRYAVERFTSRTEEDAQEVEAIAAGIKAHSSWHATRVLQTCRECCGGQGYLSVNRLGALKADTEIYTTFEGDNTVLLQLVAKSLLAGYRKQFQDLSLLGLLGWATTRAAQSVAERNPIVTRMTGEDHLRDPAFQAESFAARERALLSSLAARLRDRMKSGADGFVAFTECQDHVLGLARAHIDRLVFDRFRAGVDACADASLKKPLLLLRDLFALSRLEEDRAWFLEEGYFESGKARAIRSLVLRLCREVRAWAVPLVDAFSIPASLLAPIARDSEHG